MAMSLSVFSARRALPAGRFLKLISVTAESTPRPQWLEGLKKSEQFNGLIRNKIRDLQSCSVVPQPIAIIRYILLSGEIDEVG
jgi:hypothetical protein